MVRALVIVLVVSSTPMHWAMRAAASWNVAYGGTSALAAAAAW